MKRRLRTADRYLTIWILLAMVLGVVLGKLIPQLPISLESLSSGTTNIPLAIGLIIMMYPPLTRVRYEDVPKTFTNRRVLILSIFQNWIIGPALMFVLAMLTVPDRPELFQGLVLIGLARCIAMVIVWNDLAGGNREYATGLVAMNSLFQVILYGAFAWFYLDVLPSALGLQASHVNLDMSTVGVSVLLYLGTPLIAGYLTRYLSIRIMGQVWFETTLVPRLAPFTIIALLLTIVIMFALKAETIVAVPTDVLRVAIPLLMYFLVMFAVSLVMSRRLGAPESIARTLAFTAASNNFELAIAVAISVYGLSSSQALAAVVGPLIEVPVMLLLVWFVTRQHAANGRESSQA
ncbi:MAG TPA: arsenical-resistance protein [Bacteroidetes bacterium]|nr:arsenical-resistance protein [Bacteroidota bacterium]HRK04278.1 ACR3 family arsenite efflux transporter [Chlorobiota bacterium]